MKRIEFYLDDELWERIHKHAKVSGSTFSELVRTALREKYQPDPDKVRRIAALEAVKGLWADRTDIGDTDEYVRKLRSDSRLDRMRRLMD